MVSGVTGAKLVFTVPCQRNGTHTLLGKCVNTGDITGERAAVLNSQKCGDLILSPSLLHIGGIAAGSHTVGKLFHLAIEVYAVLLEISDGCIAALLIRNEDCVELRPMHIIRLVAQLAARRRDASSVSGLPVLAYFQSARVSQCRSIKP